MLELPDPPEWATRARTWLPAERSTVPTVAVPAEAEAVSTVGQLHEKTPQAADSVLPG